MGCCRSCQKGGHPLESRRLFVGSLKPGYAVRKNQRRGPPISVRDVGLRGVFRRGNDPCFASFVPFGESIRGGPPTETRTANSNQIFAVGVAAGAPTDLDHTHNMSQRAFSLFLFRTDFPLSSQKNRTREQKRRTTQDCFVWLLLTSIPPQP